jgi:SAM-dependent methyltransferase
MMGKLNIVIKQIKKENKKILDMGCGFGYLIVGLLDFADVVIGLDQNTKLQIKDKKPFADPKSWKKNYHSIFDVTKELIATEKPNDLSRVKLIEAKAWDTGLESESLDTVCSLDVLEHVKENNRKEVIDEISRILKNRGQFIYSVPNTVGPLFKLRCIAAAMFGMKEDPDTSDHKNYHWVNELKRLDGKFQIEKIIGYPFILKKISPSIIIVCKKTN